MIRVFNHYVHYRTYLVVLLDYGMLCIFLLAVFLTGHVNPPVAAELAARAGMPLAALVVLLGLAAGLYRATPLQTSFASMCARVGLTLLLALSGSFLWLRAGGHVGTESGLLLALAGMAAVLVNRALASHAGAAAHNDSRVLIVGCGAPAVQVAQALKVADPRARIVGYVGSEAERDPNVPAGLLRPTSRSMAEIAGIVKATEIVVALSERRGSGLLLRDLLECKINGIRVCDISTHFEKTMGQIRLEFVNPGWLVFGDGFNQGWLRVVVKRVFDLLSAMVLSVAAAPIMAVTALLIACDSKGPILYRQQRTGLQGKSFEVIKFRSMYTDAEKDGPRWAATADDRITRVGRLIRKVRIDELPQLFNVLRGDMSMVGPRPERPFFVDRLAQEIPYYNVRHSIKPGITGWAQVRYHYGSTVEDSLQKLQYDLYYVKNHTLFLDLLILAETASVVLLGKGAR